MSIATEISRLQTAKADIKAALISKGCPVLSSETIDDYAKYIKWVGKYHDYSKDYLTFISSSNNNVIRWKAVQQSGNNPVRTISYSTDKTNWTSVASTKAGVTLATLNNGDKLYLKGTENNYGVKGDSWSQFTSSGQFIAEGNIMSLIGGDNFTGITSFTSSNGSAFLKLFYGCTGLTSIENMQLTATTLADYCYYSMFYGCTSLTTTPELPATTLAGNCYQNMFYNCTSLTTAPELPATTLAGGCYYSMFQGCTGLTTAPELPVTTLARSCYSDMFNGCTSLTTAPELPARTLEQFCYQSMFQGCTSLTTAPELPVTTLARSCYAYMFYGCTSLTTAPVLSAKTLAQYCYEGMFQGCTSLNYIKAMFITTPSSTYMSNWVSGVASSGTFVKNSAATWTSSCGTSTYPCNWTVQTASS